MDANAKKTALRMIPYGMYVLTAESGYGISAATVNWVTQASFAPPLVAVGVKVDSHAHSIIKESQVFALNVLGKGQQAMAYTFFKPAERQGDEISGEPFAQGSTGAPILANTPAYVECRLVATVEKGDHSIVRRRGRRGRRRKGPRAAPTTPPSGSRTSATRSSTAANRGTRPPRSNERDRRRAMERSREAGGGGGGGGGMGPPTTAVAVPVAGGAVPTLHRGVAVTRGRKGSTGPVPHPLRLPHPVTGGIRRPAASPQATARSSVPEFVRPRLRRPACLLDPFTDATRATDTSVIGAAPVIGRGRGGGGGGQGSAEPFPLCVTTTQRCRVGTPKRVTVTKSAVVGDPCPPPPPPLPRPPRAESPGSARPAITNTEEFRACGGRSFHTVAATVSHGQGDG